MADRMVPCAPRSLGARRGLSGTQLKLLALALMLLDHGQRGRGCKALFYAFYPAHIYLLYALSWWVVEAGNFPVNPA